MAPFRSHSHDYGRAQAGAALSRKAGRPEETLKTVCEHADHVTLLSFKIVASIGVFPSLFGDRKTGKRE